MYKGKWAVDVFQNWQAAHEKKFLLPEPGSGFTDYDVHRVQTLEERFKTWTAFPLTPGLQSSSRQ